MGGPSRQSRARTLGPSLRASDSCKFSDDTSAQSEHETLSSSEWRAFKESIEGMLESQFRQQESFIRRTLEHLPLPSPRGTLTKSENLDEGWKLAMESSVKRIEAMLESQQADPVFHTSEGFAIEVPARNTSKERRMNCQPSFDSESQASTGTDRFFGFQEPDGAGGLASAGFQRTTSPGGASSVAQSALKRQTSVSALSAGSASGAACREAGSRKGRLEHRRNSNSTTTKLHWQIQMQDRENLMREIQSSRSGASSLKERAQEWWDLQLYKWLDWWMSLEEPSRNGYLAKTVVSKKFEAFCASVIIANACYTAYTTNYEVTHMEEEPMSDLVECGFLVFYVVELMLKFGVHRWYFFCNDDMKWNLLDLLLVLTAVYYQLMTWIFTVSGVDLTYMRTLRILKVARILRVIRVAKIFSELRLMLNSILGSFHSLFWSFVMLGFVFYIFGLVFVQGTATYLKQYGEEIDPFSRYRIEKTFGSVERAMLSLYKATTGGSDWENLFDDPIIERMGALNIGLFIFLIAFIQVALLNILTAVFVENALKLAQPDRDQQALEQRKKELAEAQELRSLCETIDLDNSGTINPNQFCANFRQGKLRAHLQVLGLHIKDAEVFYELLLADGEAKEVEIEDFVAGCMRLRGSATSLDLQTVLHYIRHQNNRLRQFFQACDFRFNELQGRIAACTPISARSLQQLWHSEPQQDARSAGGSEGVLSPRWAGRPGGICDGPLSPRLAGHSGFGRGTGKALAASSRGGVGPHAEAGGEGSADLGGPVAGEVQGTEVVVASAAGPDGSTDSRQHPSHEDGGSGLLEEAFTFTL